MLKIAIIGMGTISNNHLMAIEKSNVTKLVAVCDINSDKQNICPDVAFYENIDTMLEKEDIDCAHICLPHFLHVPVIIKCAKAGVNVFTEKPLGLNFEDCEKVFALEKEYGVKIGVCFQNRYNQTSLDIKAQMQTNEFGKFLGSRGIVTWNRDMAYYNEAPWRAKKAQAGGGVMINQAIHTLDLLYHIGGEFENVNAKVSNLILDEIEVEDSVMANFSYKNGANAVFMATNAYASNAGITLEFAFENATFTIEDQMLYKNQNGTRELICENETLASSKQYYGASHGKAIDAFYEAIINNTSDYINVQDAAYSLKLIDAILKSSEENTKTIV